MDKVFILCLLFFSFSWGQDAYLNKRKGHIEIYDNSTKILKSAKDLGLYQGYEIKTASKSEAEIVFKDKSVVFLSENSSLKIEKAALEKEKRDFSIEFLKGKILFFVQKMANSNFKVRTPTAVCAVRGTDFAIISSTDSSSIGLFEGSMEIEAFGEKKEIKPGNQADIASSFTVKERLSPLMEKEQIRAEKLKKYVENIRAKLEKRNQSIKEKREKINKKLLQRNK